MNRKSWRSVGAVVAGMVAIIVVTTLADIGLHLLGVFPSGSPALDDGQALLASSYRVLITVAGGWLTARLAPDRPLRHAVILGFIGALLGLADVAATWNLGLGPRWYPLSLAVLAIPECWAGGRIFEAKMHDHLP